MPRFVVRSQASTTATGTFLRHALVDQVRIGAIAPTSPALAQRLARLVPPTPELRVLELGAGTGAISAAIGPRLGPGARHFALEREPALVAALTRTAPWASVIVADATELKVRLAELGVSSVDLVISTLPWSYFTSTMQSTILAQVRSVLTAQGQFATVSCLTARFNPRSRVFQSQLDAAFARVETTPVSWANIPPARLLICQSPRR
jgi:phospholipid N-methyltransferase